MPAPNGRYPNALPSSVSHYRDEPRTLPAPHVEAVITGPLPPTPMPEDMDVPRLVDENGLVKLFANRTRSRILVTLFYADEPLTVEEIADGAGIYQSAAYEALEPLTEFDIFERGERDGEETYQLAEDDELVEEVRSVARLATERIHPE